MPSPPRSRRAIAGAAALLLGSGLAACASEDTPTDPSSGTTPSTSSAASSLDQPEQQPIDVDTAMAALPDTKDMPDDSWGSDQDGETRSLRLTYEPKQCAAVVFAGNTVTEFVNKHRGTRTSAHYAQKASEGGDELAVHLYSHDEPYPLEAFDEAGGRMDDCHEFTETMPSGHATTYTSSIVATPTLGDRSFAIRLKAPGEESENRLYVRSGHNLIIVVLTTDDAYDERMLQKYARFVLDNLKE